MKLFRFNSPTGKQYILAPTLEMARGVVSHHLGIEEDDDLPKIKEVAEHGVNLWRFDRDLPTHRHQKTGGLYHVITDDASLRTAVPIDERTTGRLTIYQSMEDHSLWVRPTIEFNDGRFERVSA